MPGVPDTLSAPAAKRRLEPLARKEALRPGVRTLEKRRRWRACLSGGLGDPHQDTQARKDPHPPALAGNGARVPRHGLPAERVEDPAAVRQQPPQAPLGDEPERSLAVDELR